MYLTIFEIMTWVLAYLITFHIVLVSVVVMSNGYLYVPITWPIRSSPSSVENFHCSRALRNVASISAAAFYMLLL